jgi:4-hydroxybenzoate polyprenyltransferase
MRLQAYAQLVRLPNVPSAWADICLGALAVGALPGRWATFIVLLGATTCLYWGGMVFNDYFDLEQDTRERPFRPIPSGRVTRREALMIGCTLLIAGVVLAFLAGLSVQSQRPTWTALLLVVAILLYNGVVKGTWAGPVVMGACRFLNVLLGVTISGGFAWPLGAHLALVVGLYVVGVTWFARREASQTHPGRSAELAGAAAIMALSLVAALALPVRVERGVTSPLFPYLLVVFGFVVGLPVYHAIASPSPGRIQTAVKRALLCLIFLDAILASAVVGTVGLALLVLMLPALWLQRQKYLYAT